MTAWWEVDAGRLEAFLRCVGGPPRSGVPASFVPVAWRSFPDAARPDAAWLAGLDVRLARALQPGERILCRRERLAGRRLSGGELLAFELRGSRAPAGEIFACRIELWTGPGGAGGRRQAIPAADAPAWADVADPRTIAAYGAATGDAGPLHERFAHGTWMGAVLEQHLLRRAGTDARLRRLWLRLLSPLPLGATLVWRPGRSEDGAGGGLATAVASDGQGRRVARARCWIDRS